jgi:hypothetical protein
MAGGEPCGSVSQFMRQGRRDRAGIVAAWGDENFEVAAAADSLVPALPPGGVGAIRAADRCPEGWDREIRCTVVRLFVQEAEQFSGMPVQMFDARLDQGAESVRVGRSTWPETMARLVAVMAGRDDVCPMTAAVLLGQQMLARSLKARGLTQC